MKLRRIVVGLILLIAIAGGVFYGWRWYTTPKVPRIALDGADQIMVETIEQARQEVAHQPRSGKSWGKLAMVLSVNGYHEPALTCFTNAAKFDPDNACWPYLQGVQLQTSSTRPQDGIPYLKKALGLARKPDQQAAIAIKLALAHVDEGQFDEAMQALVQLSKIDSDDPRVHYVMGLIASGRDDRIAAREHLNKIAEHPLCRKKACLLLAALSEGDIEAASKYRKILEQFPPDLPWSDPFEGEMARYKVNRFARIQEYQELNRQGRREEAIALLRQFMAESPDGEICLDLGIELFKKNEFKEAAETLRVALSINPQFGLGQYYLGASLLRLGEKLLREGKSKEAMELFRQAVASEDQAIALEANLGEAFEVRGLSLKYLGRTSEAIQSFREAKLVRPDSIAILIELGETLAEAGEMREAQAQLEDAVRLAKPGETRPREVLEKWKSKFKSP